MKNLLRILTLSFILFVIVLSGCNDSVMDQVEESACTTCAPPPAPPPGDDDD